MRTPLRRGRTLVRVLVVAALAAVLAVPAGIAPAGAARSPADDAATGDDTVLAFGGATFHGSTSNAHLNAPVVGMEPTPDGKGYWLVASDGGVFSFGSARFFGSTGNIRLNKPIIGMTAVPDGKGYWLYAADGGVFSFGSARFFGSTGNIRLNQPIIDMEATRGGNGYWLLASDGGVFTFGSARFYGSTGNIRLNKPVVGMTRTKRGDGYWLVASDGGMFTFGGARFHGSAGSWPLGDVSVVDVTRTPTGGGYWMATDSGAVFSFGDARFHGAAAGQVPSARHVIQITRVPGRSGYRLLEVARPLDFPLLNRGDTGPAVLVLQQRLRSLGYWLGNPEGSFGLLTEQAVTAFQKVNGLPRTGRVDVQTQQALSRAARPRPRSTSGYVVEVDKARQVIFVARNGRTEWVINTSTGTERPYTFEGRTYLADTPPGHWRVTRQVDGVKRGSLGTLYRPKYFHPDGIAFHGYPSVPAYPASHGCVRMTNAAIDWVWANNIIPLGTAVWVY